MRKALNVAWKDLTLAFRDSTALILMIVAPFALTLVIAFAFGALTGGGSSTGGISGIPVIVVNHDTGQFGAYLQNVFRSQDLADLLAPTIMNDDATARANVDANKSAAAVIIPADFSESIMPSALSSGGASTSQSTVEVYCNPDWPVSSSVIRGIVGQFVDQMAVGSAAGQVTVSEMIASGLLSPQDAATKGMQIGQSAAQEATSTQLVGLAGETVNQTPQEGFDWLTYMAPSMAIIFLMFTVSNGGKTILAERDWGTLPRLLSTPTSTASVLGGKVGGIYITGLAQMGILVAASGLAFGVRWGPTPAVVLVLLALVAAATGWGVVVAAYSRTAGQANQLGSILALVFAGLAGNFFPRQTLPAFVRTISYVSPNAWGLDAFMKLTAGGTLADVVTPIIGLLVMAVVLFGVAMLLFRRQYGK
jgi:ABC-2 type transport system permease protein